MGLTKKQKEVYDYINSYTHTHGYSPTQKEIKEHFGLKSFGSVQRYIKYLADAGLIDSDWNARRGLKIVTDSPSNSSELEIPLLGMIAAGNPIEALENPTETISVPQHFIRPGNRYFALTVKGDSMIEDGILEDDVAICRQSNDANQGQTVVAIVENEATLKHFFRKPGHIELQPANSTMNPIIVNSGDFRIAGVLVGLIRSYF